MTTRKALIIGAPDDKIPGVKADMSNLKAYFMSPAGGSWYDHEIETLLLPSASKVKERVEALKPMDYSLVFFGGHGYHSVEKKCTILHINARETLSSLDLRIGSRKHTLILDCCRKPQDDRRVLKATMESMALDSINNQKLNPKECRIYFDAEIEKCDDGLIVMNSCSTGEGAGEDEKTGGYYTSSLIDAAEEWSKKMLMTIDLSKNFKIYSTQESHNAAAIMVGKLSGNRQTPVFESPRVERKFPFAVAA